MKHLVLHLIIFLTFICQTFAQQNNPVLIKGKAIDAVTKDVIPGVNVLLNSKDGAIIAFDTTSDNGEFSISTASELGDSTYIETRCMGYSSVRIYNPSASKENVIELKESAFQLKEVNVKARKMVHSNDTTKFTVSTYARVEDQSIGDVLKNMPGFEVSPSGRISYNGNSVTDFYIEGMNLMGDRYGIATKNLSHDAVASVDVIEHHQKIKALEDVSVGQGTAVNLNLREKAKMKWIGRAEAYAGVSSEKKALWDGSLFLSAFNPDVQSMMTAKSNNSGYDAALENEIMTGASYRISSAMPDGNGRMLSATPQYASEIDQKNYFQNQTHIANSSQLWKLSDSYQLRLQSTYTDQHVGNTTTAIETLYLEDSLQCRTNTEEGRTTERIVTAQLSLESNVKRHFLKDEIIVNARWNDIDLRYMGDITNDERATNNRVRIANELQYIKPIGNHIIGFTSSALFTSHPERLDLVYKKEKRDAHISQSIEKRTFYADAKLSYGIKLGNVFVSNLAGAAVTLRHLESEFLSDQEFSYLAGIGQNDIKADNLRLMYHPSLSWDCKGTQFKAELPFDYVYYFTQDERKEGQTYFLPNIRVEHSLGSMFDIIARYSYGNAVADMSTYVTSSLVRSYREIRGSYWDLQGNKVNSGSLSVKLNDYSHTMFGNLTLSYSDRKSRWGTSQSIDRDFIIYDYVPREHDSRTYSADMWLNKGLDILNGKIQLHGMYSASKNQVEQNGNLRRYSSDNLVIDGSVSLVLSSRLSAVYKPSYLWSGMKIKDGRVNDFRQISQSLELNIRPIRRTNVKLSSGWLMQSQNGASYQHNILANAELSYTYKKWKFFAMVNNIFNKRHYLYTSYGSLSSLEMQYQLRPRDILLGGSMQF